MWWCVLKAVGDGEVLNFQSFYIHFILKPTKEHTGRSELSDIYLYYISQVCSLLYKDISKICSKDNFVMLYLYNNMSAVALKTKCTLC